MEHGARRAQQCGQAGALVRGDNRARVPIDQQPIAERHAFRHRNAADDAEHGERRRRFDQRSSAHGEKIARASSACVTRKLRAWYTFTRACANGCARASLLTFAMGTFSDWELPSGARGITSSI
jgi:hypothetical protein